MRVVLDRVRLSRHFLLPPDPDLEADEAFLRGQILSTAPAIAAPEQPLAVSVLSPLLSPLREEQLDLSDEYDQIAGVRRLRESLVAGRAALKDPMKARFIVIDTETTGTGERDRIVEIPAIEMIGPTPIDRTFEILVNPGMPISDGAYQVHGITQDMPRRKPTFARIARKLIKFIGRRPTRFVAHSADFDVNLLNREFHRAGLKFKIPFNRAICTLPMASTCVGVKALDEACDVLRINRRSRTKHRAQLDAQLCAEVFRQLVFERQAPANMDTSGAAPDTAQPFA